MEVTLWVVVDASGNVAVSTDSEEDAFTKYREDIGNDGPTRCVPIEMEVPEPVAYPTVKVVVPAEKMTGAKVTVG